MKVSALDDGFHTLRTLRCREEPCAAGAPTNVNPDVLARARARA